jgi:hypothetical protein
MVVGAAGVYLAADYADRHPNSMLGRCATVAGEMGAALNPFTVLSRVAPPMSPVGAEPQPETMQEAQNDLHEPKPNELPLDGQEEPVAPADDERAEEPMEVINVAPVADGQIITSPSRVAPEPEACEPEGPAAVVGAIEETGEPLPIGAIEESEPTRHMPYADTVRRMPYAEEDEVVPPKPTSPATAPATTDQGCGWLWEILKELRMVGAQDVEETLPPPTPSDEDVSTPPAPDTTTPAGTEIEVEWKSTEGGSTAPDAKSDAEGEQSTTPPASYSDYHHGHGCTYLGCPYPYSYTPPALNTTTAEPAPPATSPCKKAKKVKKLQPIPTTEPCDETAPAKQGDDAANPMKLDTMEYRPSDGDADAYDGLLF